jgi:LmbE family N-acetylglucosaminyl deacetylase
MTALVVVSPHLDDAVFGCSALIAAHPGATVCTVFAGVPPATQPLPKWDAICGFTNAREAMLQRRSEDRAALDILRARPCWLDILDEQYREDPPAERVACEAARVLREQEPKLVAIPAGLLHGDHEIVHEAVVGLLEHSNGCRWVLYEDAMYRQVDGALEERLTRLRSRGLRVTPRRVRAASRRKKSAVQCYASQLRGLGSEGPPGYEDVYREEGYWDLGA